MEISMAQRTQTVLERLTAGRAANLDNLDALVSSRSTHGPSDIWSQATRTLTNPGSAQDLPNMQVGISGTATGRAAYLDAAISSRSSHGPGDIWSQAARTLTNPGVASDLPNMQVAISPTAAGRAANLDNLDAAISSRATQAQILSDATPFPGASVTEARMARLDAAVSTRSSHGPGDIWTQAARTLTNPGVASDLPNMQVAISPTATGRAANLDNLDALISSRSSHGPVDVRQSVTVGTDPVDSIGRRIFDNLNAPVGNIPTNPALDTYYTATRGAYLDNLTGTQTAATYSHPSGTVEQDAVVVTPAELGKYEKLCLDLSNLAQTTTVRTYVQVDGTNYRLVDAAEFPTDFPSNAKAVVIELTPGSRTMKVTLQSAVAEGVAKDVPYFYVVRSLA